MTEEYRKRRLEAQYVKRYGSVVEQFCQIESSQATFLTGSVQLMHSSKMTKMDNIVTGKCCTLGHSYLNQMFLLLYF